MGALTVPPSPSMIPSTTARYLRVMECSFSCPARRPLVQVNKLAKAMLNKYNAEQKAAAEKKAAKAKEKEAV